MWDLHRRRFLVLTNARSCKGRIVEGPDALQGLKPVPRKRPVTFKPVQRRFADMRDQFGNRAALIFGGRRTKHLLTLPLGAQQSRHPHGEEMANQARRKLRPCGRARATGRLLKAGENDPQPARIAYEPEHLGQLRRPVDVIDNSRAVLHKATRKHLFM